MDMMDRHRVLLMSGGELPPTYTPLDYVVSVGQLAHIDTGVSGSANLKLECVFLAEAHLNYAGIMGNYASGKKSWRLILHGNSSTIAVNSYSSSGTLLYPVGGNVNNKLTVLFDTTSASVTSATGTNTNTPAAIAGTDNTANIALGRYAVDPNGTSSNTVRIRIYGCRIWNSNTLIRDFVPCIRGSDNVPGFWDKVGKTFYKSVTSTAFVYDN